MTACIGDRPAVIIVVFSYHPLPNPRAYRWSAIAAELARRGRRVFVVTTWRPGLQRNECRGGVDIVRVGNRWIEHARGLAGRRSKIAKGGSPEGRSGPGAIVEAGARLWRSIAWPDSTCTWYFAAHVAVQMLRKREPDAVLVTATPSFTSALIGLRLARAQPSLRWILDMGDPFSLAIESEPNNFALYAPLNARVERAVFARANGIAFTNDVILSRYGALYPSVSTRSVCIPPLLDPAMSIQPIPMQARRCPEDPIRLVFVGTLYRKLRRPDFLLGLFARLCARAVLPPLELHFYGDVSECAEAFTRNPPTLGGRIFVHGPVLREVALEATRSADILVDIGNSNGSQLPSKLVEYLASGRPIIELRGTTDAAAASILGSQPGVLIVDAAAMLDDLQVSEVARFIADAVEAGPIPPGARRLEAFLVTTIADAYESLIYAAAGPLPRLSPASSA